MSSGPTRSLGVALAGAACWVIATTIGLGSTTAAGALVVYGWAVGVGLLAWKAARGPGRAWAIAAVALSAVMVFLALLAVIVFILAAEGPDDLGGWIQFALYVLGALLMLTGSVQLTSRTASRPCPRCGRRIRVGVLDCPYCEFDFRTIGAPS